MRFIIRCLAGDLTKEEPLANYLPIKYDIWDEDVLDQDHKLTNLETLLANDDIRLEDAYCTYKVVYDLNLEKENKPLGPKIGQQEAPRKALKDPYMRPPVGQIPSLKQKIGASGQKIMYKPQTLSKKKEKELR